MTKKHFLVPALLSLACLAMVAGSAQAQRRGLFGRRGSNQGYSNQGLYSNNYNNGYLQGYNNPYGMQGYSNVYGQPNYSYYPPGNTYLQPGSTYVQPAPYAQSGLNPQGSNSSSANVANIRVMLPDAQAKVWVDGTRTNQSGTERYFYTPSLSPNGSYSYQVRATWMQNGREMSREQTISVHPGQTSTVDFTRGSNRDSSSGDRDQ